MSAETTLVFDPFSPEFFTSPYETFRRMRDEAPVYYNEQYDFYAISRHEDVAAAYRNVTTFSSAKGIDLEMVKSGQEAPPMLIMKDPPEHGRLRALINKVFTPRAILSLEPLVTEQVQAHLARVDRSGFDVVKDFAALFPVEVITAMMGVPPEHRQQIRIWMDIQLEREYGSFAMSERGWQAGMETGVFYYNLIQERRREPQDDWITHLIEAEIPQEDGSTTRLDDVELAAFSGLLGGAGAETVTKLIGNAIVTFGEHPDQWQEVVADRSKVPAAIEELLRYEAPAYQVRYCTQDITLHGVTIPAGASVILLPGSANRDERAFTDPDRFDINRVPESPNLGFGYGIHSCLGAALARLEGRIALNALLDFMPRFEVDVEGLSRVAMTNVIGWATVPVRVLS